MKNLLAAVIIGCFTLTFLSSCTNPNNQILSMEADTAYSIVVSIKGLDTGVLLLTYRDGENRQTDTARSTNGSFSFNGQSAEPKRAYLRLQGDNNMQLQFYLENGIIQIIAVKDSLEDAYVSATRANQENLVLNNRLSEINDKFEELYAVFDAAEEGNQKLRDSLDAAYLAMEEDKNVIVLKFISDYPASFVSAYEVNNMFIYNPKVQKFDSVFHLLDTAVRMSTIGNILSKRLEIVKKTDINQIAPDFTLNGVDGKSVALSSMRGNYLLIDFWASWCGPCRAENPNLVKTYKAFNQKGFEIVGVSLDDEKDKDKWLAAIKKDKLTWLQLSDLKGWQSEAGKLYGINAIPMNFLLDQEGKIIAKGLRGTDLDKKLDELLNRKI